MTAPAKDIRKEKLAHLASTTMRLRMANCPFRLVVDPQNQIQNLICTLTAAWLRPIERGLNCLDVSRGREHYRSERGIQA